MADETKQPDKSAASASATASEPPASSPDNSPEESAAHLQAEVEKLEDQIANLTDRLVRAHADMDNMRKRAEREKEETAKYAITKFARDIAGVADNFERAMQAVPAGAAEENPGLKTLLDGVTMTEREFLNVLERHGVRRVTPKGELFNPHQHQAMMEVQNPEVPSGTIMEVFQSGYMIDDRVLRPAMVVVAKGGQKQTKPTASTDQTSPDSTPDASGK